MRYLFLDTETGGIGLDKSLLTLYMEITKEDFTPCHKLLLELKPDDGLYHVTGKGLDVNGIDLVSHDARAITYKEGGRRLYDFLNRNSPRDVSFFVPVGHGVDGDIRHVTDKLVSRGTWEQFCSHRYLDTSSICKFLQIKGKLDPSLPGSLESLKQFLKIEAKSHTADGDVFVVKEVLKYFLSL